MRTFICLELPETTRQTITLLQAELRLLRADVAWVRAANIHLTLRFLGEVDAARIPLISEAISQVTLGFSPFQLRPTGVGAFPNSRRPRVLWVGLSGDLAILLRLQRQVEEAICSLGFPPEDKSFQPHLTIGRIRTPRNIKEIVAAALQRSFDGDEFPVDHLTLMQSQLLPHGAIYTPLTVAPLG